MMYTVDMCFRYTIKGSLVVFRERMSLENLLEESVQGDSYPGSWNPIITGAAMEMARWGLLPEWAAERGLRGMHNARIETAAVKPFFRKAWAERRCLIPAYGFYERDGKVPVRFHFDGEPFLLAGLWERGGQGEMSFTMMTQGAVGPVEEFHDRMPVMVPFGVWRDWFEMRFDVGVSVEAMGGLRVAREG